MDEDRKPDPFWILLASAATVLVTLGVMVVAFFCAISNWYDAWLANG